MNSDDFKRIWTREATNQPGIFVDVTALDAELNTIAA